MNHKGILAINKHKQLKLLYLQEYGYGRFHWYEAYIVKMN